MGFGRASVIALDAKRIYVQLKSSKGSKMNVPNNAKIWFVGTSLNNRFNGLWFSQVKGSKVINGVPTLECSTPRFEQTTQKRSLARTELNAPAELIGDEWKDIKARVIARNLSRLGLGFFVESECDELFSSGATISILVHVGNFNLDLRGRAVNSRYNWLLNRTEVGMVLSDMDPATVESVDRVLLFLGNRPSGAAPEMTESGSLARWVKASKENRKFVKQSDAESEAVEAFADLADFTPEPSEDAESDLADNEPAEES
jgi:hypothetical protein